MKLFIASPVKLNDYNSIKNDFKGIIEGKWVEEEHLHITWKYLGDIDNMEYIIYKLKKIMPLKNEISVQGLGSFGQKHTIFFAKAEDSALYDKAQEFQEKGFDLNQYKPHITLCRTKTILDNDAFGGKLEAYQGKVLGIIKPVIVLYQSELTYQGPIYTGKYAVSN